MCPKLRKRNKYFLEILSAKSKKKNIYCNNCFVSSKNLTKKYLEHHFTF